MDKGLPPPPKFRGLDGSPAPIGIGQWVDFIRWLYSLYRKAAASIDVPQSITFSPPNAAVPSADAIVGEAITFAQSKALARISSELDVAAVDAFSRQASALPSQDGLNSIVALSLNRPPTTIYPAGRDGGVVEDTAAARARKYPAVQYPDSFFEETDKNALYLSVAGYWRYREGTILADTRANRKAAGILDLQEPQGACSTSGTGVTLVSGNQFDNTGYWNGLKIIINAVQYIIDHVTDSSHLVLTTTAGAQSGVAFTVVLNAAYQLSGSAFDPSWQGKLILIGGTLYSIREVPVPTSGAYLVLEGTIPPLELNQRFDLYTFASVDYAIGALFYETDTYVYYTPKTAGGNVNVAPFQGTVDTNVKLVHWVSGDKFETAAGIYPGSPQAWAGLTITINGSDYTIASVTDDQHLVLTATAGVHSGQTYITNGAAIVTWSAGIKFDFTWKDQEIDIGSPAVACIVSSVQSSTVLNVLGAPGIAFTSYGVPRGAWFYAAGVSRGSSSQVLTRFSDAAAPDIGLTFETLDRFHQHYWTGTAWIFAPGDDGAGIITFGLVAGTPPNGGLWAACDGSGTDLTQPDGSVAAFTTPLWNGQDVFLESTGTNIAGTTSPAARALWQAGAKTEDETVHTHNVTYGVTTIQDGTGSNVAVVTLITNPTSGPSTPNAHDLANANAKLQAPSEDAAHGGLPARLSMVMWVRR